MKKEERFDLYDKATKKWGMQAQIDQAIEEMAELIVALNKYKRAKYCNETMDEEKMFANLFTELADVNICLEQMVSFFGEEQVEKAKEFQLNRFKNQIEKF
ncbi:MAG: hypothetical protein PHC46_02040 [Clostridia bacterium]|nr:hypothetical protein [Clostridia bacterium]